MGFFILRSAYSAEIASAMKAGTTTENGQPMYARLSLSRAKPNSMAVLRCADFLRYGFHRFFYDLAKTIQSDLSPSNKLKNLNYFPSVKRITRTLSLILCIIENAKA